MRIAKAVAPPPWIAVMLSGKLLALSLGVLLVVPVARADIFYSFDPTSVNGRNLVVDVASGGTVSVNLFLVFTGADATIPTAQNGLFSADIHLMRTGAVPSDPAGIASAAAFSGSPAFDDLPLVRYTDTSDLDVIQLVLPTDLAGARGTAMGLGTRVVGLGSVTITAGSIAGQSTTFTAEDTPGFSDTVTFPPFNTILDPLIGSATVSFTITAPNPNNGNGGNGTSGAIVPLPAGGAMGIVLMAVLVVAAWGARRNCGHQYA